MNQSDKHHFALYYANLARVQTQALLVTDPELCHRVKRVLRLLPGSQLTLFGSGLVVSGELVSVEPKEFTLGKLQWSKPKQLQPHLTVAFGWLKRDNLSEAIYNCAELGVNELQPIICQKSMIQPLNSERVHNILVAACEQSKQFVLPTWQPAKNWTDFVRSLSLEDPMISYIYCDPKGLAMPEVWNQLQVRKPAKIILIIGPEGGLSEAERKFLQRPEIIWMRLTPTILRATSAIALAVGTLRV